MKLGLFTALLSEMPLDAVIRLVKPLGIQALEFSTGNFGRPTHIDHGLTGNLGAAKEFKAKLEVDIGQIVTIRKGGGLTAMLPTDGIPDHLKDHTLTIDL